MDFYCIYIIDYNYLIFLRGYYWLDRDTLGILIELISILFDFINIYTLVNKLVMLSILDLNFED